MLLSTILLFGCKKDEVEEPKPNWWVGHYDFVDPGFQQYFDLKLTEDDITLYWLLNVSDTSFVEESTLTLITKSEEEVVSENIDDSFLVLYQDSMRLVIYNGLVRESFEVYKVD